jgi:ATP-binding cassette subfamily B protein
MMALGKMAEGARLSARLAGLLWPYAREHRSRIAGAVAASLLVLAFRLALPWPLKWVFDLLTGKAGGVPWNLAAEDSAVTLLVAGFLVIAFLAAAAEYLQTLVVAGLANLSVYGFRQRLFRHVMALPLTFHERRDEGEILTRLIYDTQRLRRGLVGVLLRMLRSALLFIAVVGIMIFLDPALSAIVFAFGAIAGAATLFQGQRILSTAKRSRKKEGRLATVVEENLQGVREMQTYATAPQEDPRFAAKNRKSLKSEQKLRRLEAGLLFVVEMTLAIALGLILRLGAGRVAEGTLTAGDLVLFISYVQALYDPFRQFARQASRTGRTLASASRLVKLVGQELSIADLPGSLAAPRFAGAIEFQEVSVEVPEGAAGSRRRILDKVSFRVEAGQRLAVMGSNGAGKSTLLRQVVRLADPVEGRVLIDGRDAREFTLASLRGQVSVVYQDAVLFGWSVRENIAMGRPSASAEEVAAAAKGSKVAGLIETLPDGYDTVIRRRGRLFSNGERQRIAIARARLRDGSLWLLDEPLAALDREADGTLESELLEATKGRTTLWVTHRLEDALRMDLLLYLDEGRVRFFGKPGDFKGAPA